MSLLSLSFPLLLSLPGQQRIPFFFVISLFFSYLLLCFFSSSLPKMELWIFFFHFINLEFQIYLFLFFFVCCFFIIHCYVNIYIYIYKLNLSKKSYKYDSFIAFLDGCCLLIFMLEVYISMYI